MYREFEEYVFNNYDVKEEAIIRKYYHSKRVAVLSKKIAENIGLDYHSIKLATQIGLLHDIARFYEWTTIHSFINNGFDHGSYGVYLLNKNDYYKEYSVLESDKQNLYDAIYYHNKRELPNKLKNNKYCLIIRDADKIDILYLLSQHFLYDNNRSHIINPKVLKQFNKEVTVKNKEIHSYADRVLHLLAFVYDINYDYSLKLIYDFKYLDKLYDNLENKEFYQDYFNKIKKYIEKRLNIC